jgi:hypothetical protein
MKEKKFRILVYIIILLIALILITLSVMKIDKERERIIRELDNSVEVGI